MGNLQEVQPVEKQFTLYWRFGQKELIKGSNLADAITQAGYGNGAMRALDFWANGNDVNYIFNQEKYRWVKTN